MASNAMKKGIQLMVRTDMTQREIAKELRVSEVTVSNWKKDKDYKDLRYKEEREYLGSLTSKAIKALDHLVTDAKSEYVRLQASQDILDRAGYINDHDGNVKETTLRKLIAEAKLAEDKVNKIESAGEGFDLMQALFDLIGDQAKGGD